MDLSPKDPRAATVVAGRYRIIAEIGRGNMGKVYRVEHLNTGEELAMKVLLAHVGVELSLVERFKREARAPALIKSPHVVRVIDADVAPELGGAPFLVMELLEGCDLQEYLRARGKLPPSEALGILEQVARALDRAHAVGIVHRDLKPANVFLHRHVEGVVVRVLDFGISRMAPDASAKGEQLLTASGIMMGTPLYMPPEQATGSHHKLGPGTDVWALRHARVSPAHWRNLLADAKHGRAHGSAPGRASAARQRGWAPAPACLRRLVRAIVRARGPRALRLRGAADQ